MLYKVDDLTCRKTFSNDDLYDNDWLSIQNTYDKPNIQ